MKKLFILLVVGLMLGMCGAVMADTTVVGGGGSGGLGTCVTVATLPASPVQGQLACVTDGNASTDCTTGSGESTVSCWYNGAAWVSVGVAGASTVSDAAYGAGWDGDGTNSPSKNAVYDKIETLLPKTALDDTKGNGDTAYFWSADKVFDQLALKINATALDDTKGNGDTTYIWSADKVFDQLALKQNTITRPVTGPASPTAGYLTKWNASGQDLVDAIGLGTMTNTYLCTYVTGTGLVCNTAVPTASTYHVDDILTSLGIASEATSFGTFTGELLTDNKSAKELFQEIETAIAGLPGGHTQNTDTGTSSTVFQVDAGNSGPKIKNSSGTLEVRNAADNAYAPIKGTIITGTEITATTRFYGALTGDVTGNASGTAAGLSGTPALPNGTTATTQAAGDNSTKVATTAYANALVNDTAYNASSWDGVTAIAPSKNAVRDEIELRATKANAAFSGTFTIPTTITGVLRADSGVVSADTDVTDIVAVGTTSAAGKLQLATNAETTTGTDTAKVTTPDDIKYLFARPHVIGSTTPAAATFTTLSGGGQTGTCDSTITQGFCFDADGDLFVKSVSAIRVAGQTSYSDFYEIPANGNNKVTMKSADSLAADYTVTLPSETGTLCSTGSVCTGYQASITRPVTGPASPTAGLLTKWNTSGQDLVDAFKYGTLTDGKWCSYSTANGMTCTQDTPAGAGDVTGGSASGAGELAAYTDTSGKAITRSYVSFTGPSTSVKAKTISNAADTIAELGQTNAFTALQSLNAGLAVGNAATGPGFIRLKEDSDNGTDYSVITGASDAGSNPTFTFAGSAAGSEDFAVTATTNLWTFSSSTSALFAFTPSVALNGGATIPTGNSLAVAGTGYAAFGADPADSGAVRLSNNTAIGWEQSTPGTDIFIALDSSDIFHVGQNAASISIGTSGTGNTTVVGDLTVTGNDIIVGSATNGARITGGNGLITFKGEGDGQDEDLTINLNVTNTATVSSSTGVTDVNFSALNLATTGTVTGAIPIVTKSDEGANTITAAQALGSMVLLGHTDAISDLALPDYTAAAASDKAKIGSSVCVFAASAYAHTVHPSGDDKIRTSNGTLNAAGAGVTYTTSSTPIGGYVCFVLTDAASDVGHWTQFGMNGTWPIH